MTKSKGKNSKENRLLKNFVKNQQVFFALFHKDDFRTRLIRLSAKYFPTNALEKKFENISANMIGVFDSRLEIRKLAKDFVASLSAEAQMNFYMTIHKLLKDYRLGSEWISTVVDFATTGFLVPPVFNLGMSQEVIIPKDNELEITGGKTSWKQRARATLILNPDTTLGDIQDAWKEIKKHQKASWPGYKGYKFSAKAIVRDYHNRQIEKAKLTVSEDEKYADLSEYETIQAKKFKNNMAAARKIIAQYRSKDGRKRGKITIKSKLTDMDIVRRQGLKGIAAKRAAARLRQQRHRAKNVTPFLD